MILIGRDLDSRLVVLRMDFAETLERDKARPDQTPT